MKPVRDLVNRALRVVDARLVRASTWLDVRDARQTRSFLHDVSAGPPRHEFHLPRFELTDVDLALAERVVAAYGAARKQEASLPAGLRPSGDLWERIFETRQRSFAEMLERRDVRGVAGVLVNALHHPATHGLSADTDRLTWEAAGDPETAAFLATRIVDRFAALAEALGVLPVEFPEWGEYGHNLHSDLADLYRRVEAALGFALDVPECFGLYGLRAGDAIIHPMMAFHAYTCWRIREVLDGVAAPAVCEIGGGYGGCAYYLSQLPIDLYVIVDLPLVNALQGFFLLKTRGPENVRLYGEPKRGAPIQVMPYWHLSRVPDKRLDLVMNQECLPEVDPAQARRYLSEIARTTRRWFLSINQESRGAVGDEGFHHGVVFRYVEDSGRFRRRRRFPFWLRNGEVEELYEVADG